MPNVTRLIDLGEVSGLRSQCVYHALSECIGIDSEPTLILTSPTEPCVSVGLYQETERNVDTRACRDANLPIFRRMLGGRAMIIDSGQMLFQTVFPASRAARSATKLYNDVLRVAVETYRHFGTDVHYLPVSDIRVRNARLGGSAIGRLGDAIVLASGIVLDYNDELARRVLKTVDCDYTSIAEQTDHAPDPTAVRDHFLAEYETRMKTSLHLGMLTEAEWSAIKACEAKIGDAAWVREVDDRIESLRRVPDADTRIGDGVYVAPGGQIRATVRVKHDLIDDLVLSGDFFFYEDHRHGLEQAFLGTECTWESLMTVTENYYLRNEVDSPGTEPSAWVTAIDSALNNTDE